MHDIRSYHSKTIMIISNKGLKWFHILCITVNIFTGVAIILYMIIFFQNIIICVIVHELRLCYMKKQNIGTNVSPDSLETERKLQLQILNLLCFSCLLKNIVLHK